MEGLDSSLTGDTLKLVRSVVDVWEGDCSLELLSFIWCEACLGFAEVECLVSFELKWCLDVM